jgi:nitrous oxidase accessory protein
MDVPPARFFKGAPVLEVMDFLERLAPFSEPNMLVRDERPLMTAEAGSPAEAWLDDGQGPGAEGTGAAEDAEAPGGFDAYRALRESLGQ